LLDLSQLPVKTRNPHCLRIPSIVLLLVTLSQLFNSCNQNAHPPVAFYYWKQTFQLNHAQKTILKNCATTRLYVKFFDVVINENNQAAPISKIEFLQAPTTEIIPCVYIQNAVFTRDRDFEILAKKLVELIERISDKNKLKFDEIQLDCDWSESTKENYFSFLKNVQTQIPQITISCTVRLHQVKYQTKTGVPPVDKGLLMCYNMDDIDDFSTKNSIVSEEVLNEYLNKNSSYSLPLDLALPVYQWGLVFRLGKLGLIANDINQNDLKKQSVHKVERNIYRATKNCFVKGTYLCKGDLIRFEQSSPSELIKVSKALSKTKLRFQQVIFYHLSQVNIRQYDTQFFSKINTLIP
jgi:hypothetical protein